MSAARRDRAAERKRRRKAQKKRNKSMARYIKIPKSEKITLNGKERDYSFHDLLKENCWTDEAWRDPNTNNTDVFFRIQPAFDGKGPGDIVELETKDYEVFLPIATLKGKRLPPELAVPIMKLMRAITDAPTEDPRPKAKKDEPASEEEAQSSPGAAAE